ncbi:MAG: hypothetical protein EBY44_07870 [Actinobacteria bacterium]|nr:hypothetical protein [Actinomycetota bacterium]
MELPPRRPIARRSPSSTVSRPSRSRSSSRPSGTISLEYDATLTAASTLAELDPEPTIEVHVDSAVRGLGTAACGPDVLDRFVVGPGRHRFSWTIGAAR